MKTTVKLLSLVFIMGLFSCSNEPLIDVTEESIVTEQLLEKKSKDKKIKSNYYGYGRLYQRDFLNRTSI